MISYKPLLHLLIDRDLKLTNVIKEAGLSTNIVTKINNSESITLASLEKLCKYLDCKIQDIVEII
jgi:DNA-binding Xre family transcriptional regulator